MDFKQTSMQLDSAAGEFLKNIFAQCAAFRSTLETIMEDDSLSASDPAARAICKDYWVSSGCIDSIEAAAHNLERFIELELHNC